MRVSSFGMFEIPRAGYESCMTRRLLVALDDSDASKRVADFVNRFFVDLGDVEVLALNVARVPLPWFPAGGYGVGAVVWPVWPAGSDNTVEELAAQAETRGERALRASGVESDEELVEHGDPVDVIRRSAQEHDADLVVVGTSDKGWWRRLLEGSVSHGLVHHAEVPVLVVR